MPAPGPVSRLAAVSSAVRPSSLGTRLAAAVLLGVVVLVAVPALPAVRVAGVCVGEDCDNEVVTVASAAAASTPNPVRPATPCVHDASCAGAHGGAGAGLLFAAVAAVAAGVVVARPAATARARCHGDERFRPQLVGGQLYRPPRFA